ncbi:MAG: hypothetical protein NW237_07270 [Cyanobacteriota bacterium]|nr:hypothetical protein [Cyanobacteriota bacterium]
MIDSLDGSINSLSLLIGLDPAAFLPSDGKLLQETLALIGRDA